MCISKSKSLSKPIFGKAIFKSYQAKSTISKIDHNYSCDALLIASKWPDMCPLVSNTILKNLAQQLTQTKVMPISNIKMAISRNCIFGYSTFCLNDDDMKKLASSMHFNYFRLNSLKKIKEKTFRIKINYIA